MSKVFVIHLDRLPAGRSELCLDGALPLGALDGALPLGSLEGSLPQGEESGGECQLHGGLAVDSMDQKVLVHGKFSVDRHLNCDCCANASNQRYEAELEVVILCSPVQGTRDVGTDDAWVIHQQRGPVGLDEAIREAVFLHEPQRVLCRPDCKGLCPNCGIDRNEGDCDCTAEEIDPRWAALRELRDRSDNPDGAS